MNKFLVILLLAPSVAFAAVIPSAPQKTDADLCKVSAELSQFVRSIVKPLSSVLSIPLDQLPREIQSTITSGKEELKKIQGDSTTTTDPTKIDSAKKVYENVRGQLIKEIDEVRNVFETLFDEFPKKIDEYRKFSDDKYPELKEKTNKAWDAVQAEIQQSFFRSAAIKLSTTRAAVNELLGQALKEFETTSAFAALNVGLDDSAKIVKTGTEQIEKDFRNYDYTKINTEIEKAITGKTTCP